MTDDDMDVRLRAAGAAWRTATDEADPVSAEPLSPEEALPQGPARNRRSHRVAWLASAAAIAAVLVAGGGFLVGRLGSDDHGHRATGAESAALQNTVWQLLGYDHDQLRTSSLSTFYVHDGAFVADDSCDLYNGGATVGGGHLRLSDIEDRFYNCTDSVGEVTFRQGMSTLRSNPTFSIDGDRLTISGDGPTLHLSASRLPAPTPDRPTLTGATWRLTKVLDANGIAHPVPGKAEFRIDGNHLHASDTCNTLDGTLQVDYPILKLDGLSTTEIGCPNDSPAPTVDQILNGNVRADFRDQTMTLTKTGEGTLTYEWQPDDEPATDPKRLTATDWTLRSVAGDPASGVTLRVADGRVTITAPCGSTTVNARVGNGQVETSGLRQEAAAGCPREVSSVHEMLATGPTLWRIAGKQLVLNHAGAQGFSLVFDAEKDVSAASVELPGTWILSAIEKDDGNSASGSGSSNSGVTLTIRPDFAFQVLTHCAGIAGNFEVAGANLRTVGGVISGATTCDQYARLAKDAFTGTLQWSIENGQLKLTRGKITLTFER